MDENGEILLLHASKNKARPLVLPWSLYTLPFGACKSKKISAMCLNKVNNIIWFSPILDSKVPEVGTSAN